MGRRLSSSWTFVFELDFPAIWIPGLGPGTVGLRLGRFEQSNGKGA